MNNAQYVNVVTTIVQVGIGVLVTKGFLSGSESEQVSGAIIAIATFVLSHKWHGANNVTPPTNTGNKP